MTSVFVSIYILTYKKFEGIYKCLSSALLQDYDNFEIILSDDGSPNFPYYDIKTFIENKKTKNIKSYSILRNEENRGTVKNANTALSFAKGDIFIPLAGDDFFFSKTVVSQIVENYNNTHFKLLVTSRIVIKDGKPKCLFPHYLSRNIVKKKLDSPKSQYKAFVIDQQYDFSSGSVLIIDSELYRSLGGFDEKYRLWEDVPFQLKALAHGIRIEMDHSIISLCYVLGGVSNIGGNSIMRKDVELYNSTDRKRDPFGFDNFTRRIVKYEILRRSCNDKLILLRLKYVDVLLDRLFYKLGEFVRGYFDRFFVKSIGKIVKPE